jgi:hypothetical protein
LGVNIADFFPNIALFMTQMDYNFGFQENPLFMFAKNDQFENLKTSKRKRIANHPKVVQFFYVRDRETTYFILLTNYFNILISTFLNISVPTLIYLKLNEE